jgi:hypothetical protein
VNIAGGGCQREVTSVVSVKVSSLLEAPCTVEYNVVVETGILLSGQYRQDTPPRMFGESDRRYFPRFTRRRKT